jgi:transitional endoplasmic reticulum ATPase
MNVNEVRVKDALKKDAGKGIIRLDPKLMKNLRLNPDDVIEISYPKENSKTVGILYPGKKEDEGTNQIRLDQSFRLSLGVSLDDIVSIKKIEVELAERVTFRVTAGSSLPKDSEWLAKKLENQIVSPNDTVNLYDWGRKITLEVINFIPQANAARIHLDTEIILSETEREFD